MRKSQPLLIAMLLASVAMFPTTVAEASVSDASIPADFTFTPADIAAMGPAAEAAFGNYAACVSQSTDEDAHNECLPEWTSFQFASVAALTAATIAGVLCYTAITPPQMIACIASLAAADAAVTFQFSQGVYYWLCIEEYQAWGNRVQDN